MCIFNICCIKLKSWILNLSKNLINKKFNVYKIITYYLNLIIK